MEASNGQANTKNEQVFATTVGVEHVWRNLCCKVECKIVIYNIFYRSEKRRIEKDWKFFYGY